MSKDESILRIDLDDYSYPRYSSVTRPYFGTRSNIRTLMFRLSGNQWTQVRYAGTIEAVDAYDLDAEAVHCVAGKEYPVLTPVQKIHSQNFTMNDVSWSYNGYSGAVYPARAESVEVEQMLVQQGEVLHRCAKVCFRTLQLCYQTAGWAGCRNEAQGFPGQIAYSGRHGHEMCLYTHLESYSKEDFAQAVRDCAGLSQADLSELCTDILGEV